MFDFIQIASNNNNKLKFATNFKNIDFKLNYYLKNYFKDITLQGLLPTFKLLTPPPLPK